ncbi:MAG TPA: hypothetical protein VGM98_20970 [Schlesneria sp.]
MTIPLSDDDELLGDIRSSVYRMFSGKDFLLRLDPSRMVVRCRHWPFDSIQSRIRAAC